MIEFDGRRHLITPPAGFFELGSYADCNNYRITLEVSRFTYRFRI